MGNNKEIKEISEALLAFADKNDYQLAIENLSDTIDVIVDDETLEDNSALLYARNLVKIKNTLKDMLYIIEKSEIEEHVQRKK